MPFCFRIACAIVCWEADNHIHAIAVLPFVNVGADPNIEYLADGVTEGIISSLSRVPELRVMARSTVFSYKGRDINAQKVGKELNVDAVLMGRVAQRGDTLMIQTDLVNVADGTELWGDQFNRKVSDLIAVQGDISKEIYDNLRPRIVGAEEVSAGRQTRYRKPRSLPALSAGPFLLEQVDRRRIQEGHRLFQSGSRERSPLRPGLRRTGRYV